MIFPYICVYNLGNIKIQLDFAILNFICPLSITILIISVYRSFSFLFFTGQLNPCTKYPLTLILHSKCMSRSLMPGSSMLLFYNWAIHKTLSYNLGIEYNLNITFWIIQVFVWWEALGYLSWCLLLLLEHMWICKSTALQWRFLFLIWRS